MKVFLNHCGVSFNNALLFLCILCVLYKYLLICAIKLCLICNLNIKYNCYNIMTKKDITGLIDASLITGQSSSNLLGIMHKYWESGCIEYIWRCDRTIVLTRAK